MDVQPADLRPTDEELLYNVDIRVEDKINVDLERKIREVLCDLRTQKAQVVVHINTGGGDADTARSIAAEFRHFQNYSQTPVYMVGKTRVYSAGVTILSSVPPGRRFLTPEAMLLVHERRQKKTLELKGPLEACLQIAREEVSTLEADLKMEREGFEEFIRGSRVSMDKLHKCARENWYVSAEEALGLGLIGGVIGRIQS